MPTKTFNEALKEGQFLVTAETRAIKGSDTMSIIEYIGLMRDKVHALNATDNKSAVMRYSSLGNCLLIKELGGEPVLDISCRDRNRLAIQADLLFAWSRGVQTVLCVTGDSMEVGEDKQAKVVFDLDCLQLVGLVHTLNSGRDMNGYELDGGTNFCIGVTAGTHFESDPLLGIKLQKKLDMGVDFIFTQPVYDLYDLKRFMDFVRRYDTKVKVLAGIMPLLSVAMGRYVNSNVQGIFVPDRVINEMALALKGTAASTGIELAVRMIRTIRAEKICDGVHIMLPGREERITDVLELAGLGRVNV